MGESYACICFPTFIGAEGQSCSNGSDYNAEHTRCCTTSPRSKRTPPTARYSRQGWQATPRHQVLPPRQQPNPEVRPIVCSLPVEVRTDSSSSLLDLH